MKKEAKKCEKWRKLGANPTSKPDLAGERKAPFEEDGLILRAAKESSKKYIKKLGELKENSWSIFEEILKYTVYSFSQLEF